jgi:hypothetical protein
VSLFGTANATVNSIRPDAIVGQRKVLNFQPRNARTPRTTIAYLVLGADRCKSGCMKYCCPSPSFEIPCATVPCGTVLYYYYSTKQSWISSLHINRSFPHPTRLENQFPALVTCRSVSYLERSWIHYAVPIPVPAPTELHKLGTASLMNGESPFHINNLKQNSLPPPRQKSKNTTRSQCKQQNNHTLPS